jgi:hypothetical protein
MHIPRRSLPLALLLTAFTMGSAQNLVPNPSFEDTVSCPNNLNQVNRAQGWSAYRLTPDYFNSCAVNGGPAGMPLNQFDFQYSRTGNAHAGFFGFTTSGNYREYIGTQLLQPLVIGNAYSVSMYVNRVANTSGQQKNIACNKLGMRFSTVVYTSSNPAPLNNFAHVYTDSILTDTLNWMLVSGSFTADSAYSFISIGNFFMDNMTAYIRFDSLASAAYYFVDDVSVIDAETNGIGEYRSSLVNIFPNPFRDKLDITSSIPGPLTITLSGITSEIVLQQTLTGPETLNTAQLPTGLYIYELRNKAGIVTHGKIIKE